MTFEQKGRLSAIVFLFFLLLAGQVSNVESAPICNKASKVASNQATNILSIGSVWSGAKVKFDGVEQDNTIFVAYYDATRWLTVAALNLTSGVVCRQKLPTRFGGWDPHNEIAMTMSDDGTLHVAANMHASPLLLWNSNETRDLQSLAPAKGIGKNEKRVTYPTFLHGRNGELYFLYRDGGSGNGSWFINAWKDGRWHRVSQVFSNQSAEGPVSAYPSAFVQDDAGIWHFAVVWRKSPDASTNFAVSYAKTTDFRVFQTSSGKAVQGPLRLDNSDIVEWTGQSKGLLNPPRVVVSKEGAPVVAYTRFSEKKRDAVYAARPEGGRWSIVKVMEGKGETDISGRGTLSDVPSFGVISDGVSAQFVANFPHEPPRRARLDLSTLQPTEKDLHIVQSGALGIPQDFQRFESAFGELADPVRMSVNISDAEMPDMSEGTLVWYAQMSNGDKPRRCEPGGSRGCQPPATQLFVIVRR
ncbi:MAG: BNR repeat-containing protein [Parvibaculaceae bacterium]